MARPVRLARYSIRDALTNLRSVISRHQEECYGTELFFVLERVRVELERFESGEAIKRLSNLNLEEFLANNPNLDT